MFFNKTALFVIDIQNDLVSDPYTEIPHASRIKQAGKEILSKIRNITTAPPPLIVFVQHEDNPDSGSLLRGTDQWKLFFEPRILDTEILISKTVRKLPPPPSFFFAHKKL